MNWHDIGDPLDPELDRFASEYQLHPTHIEDCRSQDQRGKVEDNNGYMFTVMKALQVGTDNELEFYNLDIFLGADWVITVHGQSRDAVQKVLDPVRNAKEALRADQVFYRICDGIVDSYLPFLDHTDDVIDDLEEVVLEDPSPEVLSKLFDTRRALIEFRRVLANTRDVCAHLNRENRLVSPDLTPFFRDLYDNVARYLDLLETQRDMLSSIMEVYLSSVANRTNEVVKVLTILGTLALPMLAISGFYGMNTKGLPFADSPHSTLIVSAAMLVSTAGLLIYLRSRRWI